MINPRLTQVIMGDDKYTHIDMREVRALQSDPARILHQRLSVIVGPGKSHTFFLNTLISYIWPDPVEGSTFRMRRQTVKEIITELEATHGWLFTQRGDNGKIMVHRRKVGYDVPANAPPNLIEPVPQLPFAEFKNFVG